MKTIYKKFKTYIKNRKRESKQIEQDLRENLVNMHENMVYHSNLSKKYSDLMMENLQLEYQNQVLRKRLFMCKRDTKIRNKRYENLISFLLHDKSGSLKIRDKGDILWDCDRFVWRILASIVDAYFKCNTYSIPSDLSEKEFKYRKELMINACLYKSEQMDLQAESVGEVNKEDIEQGVKYLIEYLPHMWL